MKSIIYFDLVDNVYYGGRSFIQYDYRSNDRPYIVSIANFETIERRYLDDNSPVPDGLKENDFLGYELLEDGTISQNIRATIYNWDEDDHLVLHDRDKIKHLNPIGYLYKQVIVIRKDLKMRRGKECAQVAHASMAATLENMEDERVKHWLSAAFAKACVCVNSEEELLEIYRNAKEAGAITSIIKDAGRTEFRGVPTFTTVAVGPGLIDDIDAITGDLKLY